MFYWENLVQRQRRQRGRIRRATFGVAAVVAAGLVFPTLTASSALAASTCSGSTCTGKSPIKYGCDADAQTISKAVEEGEAKTWVSIRYSAKCKAAWAKGSLQGGPNAILDMNLSFDRYSTKTKKVVTVAATSVSPGKTAYTKMYYVSKAPSLAFRSFGATDGVKDAVTPWWYAGKGSCGTTSTILSIRPAAPLC